MKKKLNVTVEPSASRQTLDAFFRYFRLSSLLFDAREEEIYNVTDIPVSGEFYELAKGMAKQLNINWTEMTHEDSNRIMLALLESSFNTIREIEDSKSIVLQVKMIVQ